MIPTQYNFRCFQNAGKGRGGRMPSPGPTPEPMLRVIIPQPGEVVKTSDEDKRLETIN